MQNAERIATEFTENTEKKEVKSSVTSVFSVANQRIRNWIAVVALLAATGCVSAQRITVQGPREWSSRLLGGITFTLPEGAWLVETPGDAEGVTVFHQKAGTGSVALWCIETWGESPPWLSLQALFLEFRDKHELGRRRRKTRAGDSADCVDFLLGVDERRIHATGCAVRRGFVTIEVIAWGFEKGRPGSRSIAEAIIDTVAFPSISDCGGLAP